MTPSLRASTTVVCLYLVSRVYGAVLAPWTAPIVEESKLHSTPRPVAPLPSDASLVAKQYLTHAPWTVDAEIVLHREKEGFVYFNDSRRIEDGRQNRVRFTPFALVWFDPRRDDGVPFTVTCESAVVEFKEKFDPKLGGSEDNRIVGGQFGGEVRIAGPDGLEINGRSFVLSEGQGDYGLLLSDSEIPITFAYGPAPGQSTQVRGQAVQFEVRLTMGDDSLLGQDMPRITGIERIWLRQDVAIDLTIDDKGKAMPVSIQSDGRFEYDVERMLAEFNDNVHVTHSTHRSGEPEQYDQLHCDRLSLSFEPKPAPDESIAEEGQLEDHVTLQQVSSTRRSRKTAGLDLDLQLRTLTAVGREVVLTSDKNQLHGTMGELFYNVGARTVQIRRDEKTAHAELRLGTAMLNCGDIRILHDEEGQVRAALCEGAGQAWQIDPETDSVEVEASWGERLSMVEDPEVGWDRLELIGEARVVHQQQQMGAVGDVLRVWFDAQQLQNSGDRFDLRQSPQHKRGQLALHKVVAEQAGKTPVLLVSPAMRLESSRVEAEFVPVSSTHPLDKSDRSADPLRRSRDNRKDQSPVFIRAGAVRALVSVDEASEPTVTELIASTDVRLRRDGTDSPENAASADGTFAVGCESLTLRDGDEGQVLRLQGAPATVRLPKAEIEGRDIQVNRDANSVQVLGSGAIAFAVEQDLEGCDLESPERLRIRWKEQMQFDGKLATFLGETETTLADSVMKCHQMDVTLDRQISFTEDQTPHDPKISRIHCRNMATLEYHQFSDPQTGLRPIVTRLLHMKVAEFLMDQTTGDFFALGPGQIEDWQREDGRRRLMLSPRSTSRANQSAEVEHLPWSYTWLAFSGELTGNQQDRFMVMKDRVKVIHGPVELALQPIHRSDLDSETETAKNAAWLQSDQMNLRLTEGPDSEHRGWLEVVAFGNAEMEGKVFRARADTISYDESKEKFTLKGRGTDAAIYYQEAPGRPDQRSFARTIHFVPSKRKIELEESSGIRIVP